jgi:type IV pilus assembly protein PilB
MKKEYLLDSSMYNLRNQEEKLRQGIVEDPIVVLVDSILYNAIASQASDIHLESREDDMRVRYRIDGVLYDQDSIAFAQRSLVVSRLKILSSLDIAQRRIPQDGKVRIVISDSPIDLRVSTFPSIYGEKMVIRILDRSRNCLDVEELGFSKKNQKTIVDLIGRQHGFFLVTGPTGSGKTTTLYAVLSKLNDSKRNIVTMEDPVEYNLEGITQSQVNLKSGFNFENGLRSIVRQDPDVIMIGEIRDKPTVQIAIEAALTGHVVLSTLHTTDASGALTRLIDMGVEPFLINASLTGVLAQRLVRRLCERCKEEVSIDKQQKELLDRYDIKLKKLFKANGCRSCFNLGYKGREAISELLVMNDELRNLIMEKAPSEKIKSVACDNGMTMLKDDLASKLEDGVISLDEFLCVIGE